MKLIRKSKDLKVGDLVKVNFIASDPDCHDYKWTGICNWHDGSFDGEGNPVGNAYKFSFIVVSDTDTWYKPNQEVTWTIYDLAQAGAEVISESR